MATPNSTKRDGLYKQPGSDYWYMSYTHNGMRVRRTTKCTNYEAATQVLQNNINKIKDTAFRQDWIRFVEDTCDQQNSWLRQMLKRAMQSSKRRDRICTLTLDQLKELAILSNGRCMVTGIQFRLPAGQHHDPLVPSLDRIESNQGYIRTNCRLVCMAVNFAMNRWGEEVMLLIAKGILHKHLCDELGYPMVGNGGIEPPTSGL